MPVLFASLNPVMGTFGWYVVRAEAVLEEINMSSEIIVGIHDTCADSFK